MRVGIARRDTLCQRDVTGVQPEPGHLRGGVGDPLQGREVAAHQPKPTDGDEDEADDGAPRHEGDRLVERLCDARHRKSGDHDVAVRLTHRGDTVGAKPVDVDRLGDLADARCVQLLDLGGAQGGERLLVLDMARRGAVRRDDQPQRLPEATRWCHTATTWPTPVAGPTRPTATGAGHGCLDVLVELLDQMLVQQDNRQRGGGQGDGEEEADDRGDELARQ